jgi:hypothetical protein
LGLAQLICASVVDSGFCSSSGGGGEGCFLLNLEDFLRFSCGVVEELDGVTDSDRCFEELDGVTDLDRCFAVLLIGCFLGDSFVTLVRLSFAAATFFMRLPFSSFR